MKNSYFDGGLATYIGTSILATLITVFTLGICAPWGICMMYNWKIKHTVIDGKRLILTVQLCNYSVIGLNGFY